MNPAGANRSRQEPVDRGSGAALLLVSFALLAAGWVLSHVLGLYFPILLLAVGPMITMGSLTLIHPRFFDALVAQGELTRVDKAVRLVSFFVLLLGVVLGVFLLTTFRGDA